ncbi:hypothetical protein BXZ70DRAFT_956427 [Cristinia sonorae]|uniref:Uncharacterized protein n=1 Tax=Cristinia sonorae TaxID=1940300 RepID=A0A8K0XL96_9AGAR|nr:hypothetical protein BXZ70DRAFT_956427 [Cristinia sonorae]
MSESDQAQNPNQNLAAKLKEEGNTFFLNKDYQAAYDKYSKALKIDDSNAILYANRAACCQNLHRFLDAATDGKRATEIDPLYPKAWARLAAAQASLDHNTESVKNWKRAIEALPVENLTAAELKQKTSYQSELKAVERKIRKPHDTTSHQFIMEIDKFPWKRAEKFDKELEGQGVNMQNTGSSGNVILAAYLDWSKGMDRIKQQRRVQVSPNSGYWTGAGGAIALLVSAILRDVRVFHTIDADWEETYTRQVQLEAQTVGAWFDIGPEQMKTVVLERLRTEPWDGVRKSMALTIRVWIMRGFMGQLMKREHSVGVGFIGQALEFLRWGAETWKDVSYDDKGGMFHPSMIRGVHHVYIHVLRSAVSHDSKTFSADKLQQEAEDLIKDCDSPVQVVTEGADAGFILSFTKYPRAMALSSIGFCYEIKAGRLVEDIGPGGITEAQSTALIQYLFKAVQYYIDSASSYPADDELHLWNLSCALKCAWQARAPLSTTFLITEGIRRALPDVNRIWEHASISTQGAPQFRFALQMEQMFREKIAEGSLSETSQVAPDYFKDVEGY